MILFIFKIFELLQFKSSRSYEYMKIKYERELRGEELYELYDAMIFFHSFLHPAVLMYDFHIIHNVIIILSRAGFITNQFNDRFQSAAQVSQRSRVRIPYKPNFLFRLSFRNCISCVYYCDNLLSYNSNHYLH